MTNNKGDSLWLKKMSIMMIQYTSSDVYVSSKANHEKIYNQNS